MKMSGIRRIFRSASLIGALEPMMKYSAFLSLYQTDYVSAQNIKKA